MVNRRRNRLRTVLLVFILSAVSVGAIYTVILTVQLKFFPGYNVTFNDIDVASVTKIEVQTFDHTKTLQTISDTKTISNTVEFLRKYNGRWSIPFDSKYPAQNISLRFFYKVGFPNGEDGISFGEDSIVSQGAVREASKNEIKNFQNILGIQ